MYVASWMIISNTYGKNFTDTYYENAKEELRQSDLAREEIDAKIQSLEEFQEMYKNPVIKIGITYMEILPVGLLITLISASVLHRKSALSS